MNTSLRAYLFGTFEIHRGNIPLTLPGSISARSLLAYLCLNCSQPVPRPVLAGTFWPEQTESAARRALSQALWHIRRAIPDLITADAYAVQISPESLLWIDVVTFQTLIETHSQLPSSQEKAASDLHQATQLYRGDLLSGLYDEWIFIERESLREQYLQVLELLIHTKKSSGQYVEALQYGRQLVQVDPLRENTYRSLMQINLALGRSEAAIKIFEDCQQTMLTELGVEPEAETIALAEEIQTQSHSDPLPYLPPNLIPATPLLEEYPKQFSLVGREQERMELVTCMDGMFENLGGVMLVEGEAGIGKTRLLQEAVRDAEWRGAQTLWGSCREIEGVTPYHALVEAIRNGLSHLRTNQLVQLVDDIWLQVLAHLIPELLIHAESAAPPSELAPDRAGERLNNAFEQLFRAWAQITPIMLIIEDIHWAGADLMNILLTFAARLRDQRIIILVTFRSEDVRANPEQWEQIQNIDRAGLRGRLLLNGLNAKGSGELVRRALRLANPAPLFEERIHHKTEGNPLFLLETLRSLLEESILTKDANGNWHTPWDETTADYGELPTPPAVEGVIIRRLENLEPQFEKILRLGAVLGEYFDFAILQAVCEMKLPQLLSSLSELVCRRFLVETEEQYGFSHARVREVIYNSIPLQQRRNLHRQVGKILEQLASDQIARLAHHFYQAQVWEKNLHFSKLAGDQATNNYANNEALAHYSRALELIPSDRVSERYEVLLAREKIYDLLGDREAQAQDLEALAVLAEQLQSAVDQAEVALRQAHHAEAVGDYADAIEIAKTAVSFAKQINAIDLEGRAYLEGGRALWRQGSYDAARGQFEQALALALEENLRWLEADALNNLGNVCLYQGEYSQAKDYYEQTLPLHRDLGNRQGEGNATYNLGYVVHDMGDLKAACNHYQKALHIYQEIGFRRGEGSAHNIYGITQQDLGNYLDARLNFEQAERIFKEIGDQQSQAQALANTGAVLMDLGRYAVAHPYFEQGLKIQHELGDRRGEGAMLASLSSFFLSQDDYKTAEEHARQALSIFDELGDRFHQGFALTYLGHALSGLGKLDAAIQAYQHALDIRRDSGETNRSMGSLADLARVALIQNNLPQAMDYVEQIWRHLETGNLDGTQEPLRVYLTCYRTLRVNNDPRAINFLEGAYRQLTERATLIDDDMLRRSYLENVAHHRELAAAYSEWQTHQTGRQIEVRLPKSEAPTGRPLRDDEWVQVTWTVEKPGDEKISNKREQRQSRLLRLLGEAESQGGAPNLDNLSNALKVSVPTIKRDLAALRKQGHPIQTRGSRST